MNPLCSLSKRLNKDSNFSSSSLVKPSRVRRMVMSSSNSEYCNCPDPSSSTSFMTDSTTDLKGSMPNRVNISLSSSASICPEPSASASINAWYTCICCRCSKWRTKRMYSSAPKEETFVISPKTESITSCRAPWNPASSNARGSASRRTLPASTSLQNALRHRRSRFGLGGRCGGIATVCCSAPPAVGRESFVGSSSSPKTLVPLLAKFLGVKLEVDELVRLNFALELRFISSSSVLLLPIIAFLSNTPIDAAAPMTICGCTYFLSWSSSC
mmetsp:Transcript_158888/g.296163  ORF Transcript_158888/g.296163 Transcript_158888/m.296163 type:complete len:271 (+) Transcript_158888:1471-2283(+)